MILNDDTEVIISPKIRKSSQGMNINYTRQNQETSRGKERSISPIVKQRATSLQSRPTNIGVPINSTLSNDIKPKKRSSWNPFKIVSGFIAATNLSSIENQSQFYVPGSPVDNFHDGADRSPSVSPEREFTRSQRSIHGLNFKFRVQSLKVHFNSDECELDGLSEDDIFSKSYLKQPNIVFVNSEDIQEQISNAYVEVPDVFLAKLTRLSSPKDIYARAEEALANQKKEKADKLESSSDSTSLKTSKNDKKEKQLNCIVRVVILTKKGLHSHPKFISMIEHVLDEQPCLRGHVIVPDLLRRLMNLDVTRSVWLKCVDVQSYPALAFDLQPVTSVVCMLYICSNQMINN